MPNFMDKLLGKRAIGFWATTEDASSPKNRIISGGPGGKPIMDYSLDRIPHAVKEHHALIDAWIRHYGETIYHPVGTCKMGNDPMAVVLTAVALQPPLAEVALHQHAHRISARPRTQPPAGGADPSFEAQALHPGAADHSPEQRPHGDPHEETGPEGAGGTSHGGRLDDPKDAVVQPRYEQRGSGSPEAASEDELRERLREARRVAR